MSRDTPTSASNITIKQPEILQIHIAGEILNTSLIPFPAGAPKVRGAAPKGTKAAGFKTRRKDDNTPPINATPEDLNIGKLILKKSGKFVAPSGEGINVSRLKVIQPQTHSTIPWPVTSLQRLQLPIAVIENTHEMSRIAPWILGNMVLYPAKSLGKGTYANVISGFNVPRSTDEASEVAIKLLPVDYKQEFARECNAMAILSGTGTLPELLAAGQGSDYFYIVMEKFRTTFDAQLCIYRRMGYAGIPCDKLPRVVKEILLLISEMHDQHMVHFDIKPCNILVAENGRLVLSDAAFCHKFPVHRSFEKLPYRGTEGFMAPEVFVGEDVEDARPADMYSLGMTIAMARGVKLPDANWTLEELEEMVDAAFPPECQMLANDFLTKLVVMPHAKRMTVGEALAHPWLEGCNVEQRDNEWMRQLPAPKKKPLKLPHPGNIEEIVLTDEGHIRSVSSILRGCREP